MLKSNVMLVFMVIGGIYMNSFAGEFRYPATFNNITSTHNSPGYKPAPLLSDEDFYGKWDDAAKTWIKPGLFDYAEHPALKAVSEAARTGDYKAADKALLDYYRKRDHIDMPELPDAHTPRTKLKAELFMDQVYFRHGQEPFHQFEVSPENREYVFDVTTYAKEGKRSFLLMARKKGAPAAIFNSREAKANRPQLRLTVGVKQSVLEPEADTTVQFEGKPRGGDPILEVRGSKPGEVVDKETCRALVKFDLGDIVPATIEKAELVLHGKSNASGKSVPVLLSLDFDAPFSARNEANFSWNNMAGNQFSYEGLSGLKAWRNPKKGSPHGWFFVTGIVRFVSYPSIVAMYQKTGDERYAKRAIQIYLDYVEYQMFNRLDDGSRASHLVRPSQVLYKSPSMTPQALKIMIEHAWRVGNWYAAQKNWHANHNFGSSYISGSANLAYPFPELRDVQTWWRVTNERALHYTSKSVFGNDHSFREPNTAYACPVLNALNEYRTLVVKSGATLEPRLAANFRGMARYAMDVSDPSGTVYPYGDTGSPHRFSKDMIKTIAIDHNDPELLFIATDGKEGLRPRKTSAWYPDTKLGSMRTAWVDKDALGLFVNARPNGGCHWQPNALSVCVYAYGQQLLDDTYHYPGFNRLRRGVKTREHNTIEINGKSQGEKDAADGTMLMNPQFDLFDGYTKSKNEGENEDENGFTHQRRVLLVKPSKFWIVSDHLKASVDDVHSYNQTWHPRPGSKVAIDEKTRYAVTDYPSKSNIRIVPADPQLVKASLVDGWWGTEQNKSVSYVKRVKGSTTFDTVLFPMSQGANTDVSVSRLELDVPPTVATALAITIDKRSGRYYLSYEEKPAERSFGGLHTDARMVYLERGASGQLLTMAGGIMVRDNKQTWVQCTKPISDLAVEWDVPKKELRLSTAAGTLPGDLEIHCPFNATSVQLNDKSVDFSLKERVITVKKTR